MLLNREGSPKVVKIDTRGTPLFADLENRGRVWMRYVDARGQETTRAIRPLYVREQSGNLYLTAHCHRAKELRTFRLDRVVEMRSEDPPGDQP